MEYAIRTDIGDRKRASGINEDGVAVSVVEDGHRAGVDGDGATRGAATFALADGAGGHEAGDVASYIVTTAVVDALTPLVTRAARGDPAAFDVDVPGSLVPDSPDDGALEAAIESAVVEAHRDVLRYAAESGTRAYTTVVAGVVVGGRCHYGWVGDSRAYLVNEARNRIELLTKDHAVVEEMADAGDIDDVTAHVHPRGNEITRAVGGAGREDPDEASVPVETNSVDLYAEDTLVVTSDGLVDAQTDAPDLYDYYLAEERSDDAAREVLEAVVTDGDIRDRVLAADSLSGAAADLVDFANGLGGKDNLSVLLVRDRSLSATPTDRPLGRALEPDPIEDRATVLLEE